jgi:hypothetical protein
MDRALGTMRWGVRLAGAALLAALGIGLSACGVQTPPRPASSLLPPMENVQARRQPEGALLSWPAPDVELAQRYGGVTGFRLLVEDLPLLCGACPPTERRTVALRAGSEALEAQGGRIFHRMALSDDDALVRIRVVTEYGIGLGRPSRPVTLEALAKVPVEPLHWERVRYPPGAEPAGTAPAATPGTSPPAGAAASAGGTQAVRLYWEPRRERVISVIQSDGQATERDEYYRGNLYRRVPPAPWPLAPLNVKPLAVPQLILPLFRSGQAGRGATAEFTLRLVDHFGNEGPPAPPITVPLDPDAP